MDLPQVIPGPSAAFPKGKTIVLCFDGTSGMYRDNNTNVVKFFGLLKKTDRNSQVTYYQSGIGTYLKPGMFTSAIEFFSRLLDQGIALHLDVHVIGGYEYLMQHYHPGDKICLFGFSRGAYTARALAGMLTKVGLLPPDNREQVTFAYNMYKRTGKKADEDSHGFKKTFSAEVEIEFVGVWDTVSSVGIWYSHYLPFTASNYIIKTFRQATNIVPDSNRIFGTATSAMIRPGVKAAMVVVKLRQRQEQRIRRRAPLWAHCISLLMFEKYGFLDVSDVGGGAIENENNRSLANITLRWMVRQCALAKTGIQFDPAALQRVGIDPSDVEETSDAPVTKSKTATDSELENAASPVHDRLKR